MKEKIRAFIAIELTEEIQDSMAKIQNELRASGADVKWVKPKNIHITLKFLGDIDTDLIAKIKNILEAISQGFEKFPAQLSQIGAFPRLNSPRVIWVGTQMGNDKIIKIAEELENNLFKIGFTREEKAFHPHATLGRVRTPLNRLKLVEALNKETKTPTLNFMVDKILIFKSTLTPQGPIYEAIDEVSLKAS